MIRRLRAAPKTPLAVAGILATPLFFVALMAFSLLLEEPTVEQTRRGTEVLGEPTHIDRGRDLRELVPRVGARRAGSGSPPSFCRGASRSSSRSAARSSPRSCSCSRSTTWQKEHTARYPDGVDLIPRRDPSDLILRGEWEEAAKQTADQIGLWTIAIAVAAIAIHVAFEVRRRRGIVSAPPPPPPPETVGPA